LFNFNFNFNFKLPAKFLPAKKLNFFQKAF